MTNDTRVSPDHGRGRGQRGSAVVAALVLLFAFTAGGVIWLARDVNRVVANRSAAQSIAFQSARAGAQQIDVDELRVGDRSRVVLDEPRAHQASRAVASELLAAYGLVGSSSMTIDGDQVTVRITVDDPAGSTTATGTVRAQSGP